jgi:glycosyltransferase involved in cell wall biosynthesis
MTRPATLPGGAASEHPEHPVLSRRITVVYMDLGTAWRGGQRQMLWMAEGLRRAGGRAIFALRPRAVLAERARASGLDVVHVDPTIAELGPWTVMRLRRLISRERVDILHPQGGHDLALAAMASLGTNARVVFARRTTFSVRRNLGTRLKYARADRIISVSHAGVGALLEAGLDPSRIEVIPSGIPVPREVAPVSREALAHYGVEPGDPLVVMVGAVTDQKDPITFVRAIAVARRAVPRLRALLVGEGNRRGEVEGEVRALGLGEVVRLTGFRSDSESFIAAADVVCLSSATEGTPGVLLDALALGRPIAATAAGGVSEVVEDGVSGLLTPVGDADALGASIARILLDPALAGQLSAAARSRASLFSIDRTVARTLAVYERTLAVDART